MEQSPLAEVLAAIDHLDIERVVALSAPDCRLTTVDRRQAHGRAEAGQLLSRFLSQVRSTRHEITSQWHVDDTWIAEVLASYEMQNWLKIEALPRVFVLQSGPDRGSRTYRVYGTNEHDLSGQGSGDETERIGGRLVLPL